MATAGRAPATTAPPSSAGHDGTLSAIASVERRARLQRAINAAPPALVVSAIVAVVGICGLKLGEATLAGWALGLACLPPLSIAVAALRRTSPLSAARLIDAQLGEHDLLASAWAFGRMPASERTPFMEACIDSAARRAALASPAEALPLRWPRGSRESVPVLLGLGLLAMLEVPVRVALPPEVVARPRLLQQDDIAAFAEEVTPIATDNALDPGLREAASELNAMLEALEQGELEREEALRELRRLEAQLAAELNEAEHDALREALAELGRQLGKQDPSEALAEALRDGDARRAQAALAQLGKELDALSKKQAAALKKQLERAAKAPKEQSQAEARAKRELERLLKKKREQGELSKRDKRLLKKKKRQLDRLERERKARAEARRRLEQLRRNLGGAAGQMGQASRRDAARQLSQGAESMEQLARQQLSREQRDRLKKQLEQLRQLMSKQGGQQQQKQAGGGQQGKQGQPLGLDGFSRAAQGEQGKGQNGQNGKQGKGLMIKPGAGGQPAGAIEMPGMARRASGSAELAGGDDAGEGGRSRSGRETRLDVEHEATHVSGEKGRGPTRSEVIREAGSRGFVSQGYDKVHTEYEKHAESVLERDEVPGGYRFYVRRYFQLIRPREGR